MTTANSHNARIQDLLDSLEYEVQFHESCKQEEAASEGRAIIAGLKVLPNDAKLIEEARDFLP